MAEKAEEQMKRKLSKMAGYVLMCSPAYSERKRVKLSIRLHRIFMIDAIEGSLDVAVRGRYATE